MEFMGGGGGGGCTFLKPRQVPGTQMIAKGRNLGAVSPDIG